MEIIDISRDSARSYLSNSNERLRAKAIEILLRTGNEEDAGAAVRSFQQQSDANQNFALRLCLDSGTLRGEVMRLGMERLAGYEIVDLGYESCLINATYVVSLSIRLELGAILGAIQKTAALRSLSRMLVRQGNDPDALTTTLYWCRTCYSEARLQCEQFDEERHNVIAPPAFELSSGDLYEMSLAEQRQFFLAWLANCPSD